MTDHLKQPSISLEGIASTKQNKTLDSIDCAILVAVEMPHSHTSALAEFKELVSSAAVETVHLITGKRKIPDRRLFVGLGKAEEIKLAITSFDANVVIFNHDLLPNQIRNLEKMFQCRVIDRTGLILDIFSQRAQSFEGKLQVELAQLQYLSTRLVRMWTHLERQKGGIGLRGGAGETQLEADKRMINVRIEQIQRRLKKVEETRKQGRLSRKKSEIPVIALIGYTNSGKSSLFNVLTNSDTYSENKLFATLDPTHRVVNLPQVGKAILIDTVGFISCLPHELIAAFKSTLQEAIEADLLIEVIDYSDSEIDYKKEEVFKVLQEIRADDLPRIRAFNKIDLLEKQQQVNLLAENLPLSDPSSLFGQSEISIKSDPENLSDIESVAISVKESLGIESLKMKISQYFQKSHFFTKLKLSPEQGKLRAQLFKLDAIVKEEIDELGNFLLEIYTAKHNLEKLASQAEYKAILEPILDASRNMEEWELMIKNSNNRS